MKTVLFFALALTLFGALSHADVKKCVDDIFVFQPASADVKTAADSFGAYATHEIGSCAVSKKLKLSSDSGISFKGFRVDDQGNEIIEFRVTNYKLNFTDKCQITVTKTGASDPLCEPGPYQ